jgi:hypothetical protein
LANLVLCSLILVYTRWVTPGALAQDLAASKDQRTKYQVQAR